MCVPTDIPTGPRPRLAAFSSKMEALNNVIPWGGRGGGVTLGTFSWDSALLYPRRLASSLLRNGGLTVIIKLTLLRNGR